MAKKSAGKTAEPVVVLARCSIRVPRSGLARAFKKLKAGGHLLTDAAGEAICCSICDVPIFTSEAYGADKGGIGASKFWCEECATNGGVNA